MAESTAFPLEKDAKEEFSMSTSRTEHVNAPQIPIGYFTSSDCGQDTGTATGDLPIDGQMAINDKTDLSNCVVGPDGAYVKSVEFKSRGGLRHGEIIVFGAGPSGTGSGTLDLVFKTAGGGTHTLSLWSSSPQEHTDRFEDTTDIVSMSWSHG
jgi:hypothetical protein